MMVFNVELGFTALPHLPDLPARGILQSPAYEKQTCASWRALSSDLNGP
jgi:hypothetical protein